MSLKALFGRRSSQPEAMKAAIPSGQRLYVIGDVHGMAHLLDETFCSISEDLKHRPSTDARIILLGDLIDRGPDSAGVIARITSSSVPAPVVALRGNHEAMLLQFLEDPKYLEAWRGFGGMETLHSYRVDVSHVRHGKGFDTAHRQLLNCLPDMHLNTLRSARTSFQCGDYFFCHAGIRPGVKLEDQREFDLLWIREEFLTSQANHGKIIVHGHTPVEEPDFRSNRINIDTGAYLSGTLTCLTLEGSQIGLLTI